MFNVLRLKVFFILLFLPAFLFPQQNPAITTSSGLQYEVINRGNGNVPCPTDTVHIRYRKTHSNGNVIVNSAEDIAVLNLENIITGLSEGLQLMNEGSIYRFVIPPNLNAPYTTTDVYIIELISILTREEITELENSWRDIMPYTPHDPQGNIEDLIQEIENMSDEEFFNLLMRMFK